MQIDLDKVRDIDEIEDYADRLCAAAVMYVEEGFKILPVRPNGKALPVGLTYNSAVDSAQRVVKWWGPKGKYHGYGISIAGGCGRIAIIDLDVKDGMNGPEEWHNIVDKSIDMFGPRSRTPSGGTHLLFRYFDGAKSVSSKVAPGIDIRGGDHETSSGHALVWPTISGAQAYQWVEGGEVMDAPDTFIDRVQKVTTLAYQRKLQVNGRGQVDQGVEVEVIPVAELKKLMARINPLLLTYDDWLKVGMALHSHQPSDEGRALWEEWSASDTDRYTPGDCAKKWAGFNRPGSVTVGTLKMYGRASEAGLTPVEYVAGRSTETQLIDEKVSDIVEELNKTHAIITIGNKARVIIQHPTTGPLDRGYDLLSKEDFMTILMNRRVIATGLDGKVKIKTWAEVWLGDGRRKEYKGIVMDPSKPKEYEDRGRLIFNMWCGWAVDPVEGDWTHFREHIRTVICSEDDYLFNWVLDWMAFTVQKPDKLPGTAIVLRGGEGAGKGTFAHMFGRLFGRHYRHLTQHEHLVGKFNSMLEDAVLLFADEVTYGGDRRTAGVLKGYVTEATINVERKGLEASTFKNNIHLIIASNEDWVVPAGPTARRWMCLDVSKSHLQDRPYFAAIHRQMEDGGGLAAMFFDLLKREITNDVAVAPETKMRDEQKAQYMSSDPIQSWWYNILMMEQIPFALESVVVPGTEDQWPEGKRFKAPVAYGHFEEWNNKSGPKGMGPGSHKFYNRLIHDYGAQKTKINGVNYLRFGSLEYHKAKLIDRVGFDIFAIHNSEERDDEN